MSTPASRRRIAWLAAVFSPLAASFVLLFALAPAVAGCAGDTTSGAGGSSGWVVAASPAAASAAGQASGRPASSRPTAAAGSRNAAAVSVTFVDVGQGDAAVVKSGSWACLIDGGPPGAAVAVETALRGLGVRRLAAVVVTHPHQDHTGGLPVIIRDFRPRRAYVGPGAGGAAAALRAVGTAVKRVRRGGILRFGALKARVLSPGPLTGDANEDSVVLALDVRGRRFLFTGDCTGAAERAVAAICARGPPVSVLKVAHHGSKYSTLSGLLSAARPRVAVISAGRNSYGHPARATLARLRTAGARVYATRHNGAVTVTVTSGGKLAWRFSGASTPIVRGDQPR